MRRRPNPLRRLDRRMPAPAQSTPGPTPDAPVAWAQDEDATEASSELNAHTDPGDEPSPAAGDPANPSSELLEEPGQPEPETAMLPVPAEISDPPVDAAAAPPLEVLSVQPDGTVLPAPDPSAPAGTEPGTVPDEPGFRIRGRLRRRLRYLRRVRELGLRDLGGLIFDLHRFERQGEALVAGKLAALTTVDGEVRELEAALDDRRELVVLREPGLAACPRCAALHGSDANFCPNCGMPFSGGSPAAGLGAPPAAPSPSPLGPGPSSVTAAHPVVQEHGPTPGPA